MARLISRTSSSRRQVKEASNCLFFVTASLAILTTIFIFFYMSSTSELLIHPHLTRLHVNPQLKFSTITPQTQTSSSILQISLEEQINFSSSASAPAPTTVDEALLLENDSDSLGSPHEPSEASDAISFRGNVSRGLESQLPKVISQVAGGNNVNSSEVFHDRELFLENYNEMNRSLKIYVYPHKRNDPFANVLLPVDYEPGGNYASESYFKKALFKSHFITKDPSEADLFYLPFSIASLRHDKRVGVGGIQKFIRKYIYNISHSYPYWNRTGGADHFYVACHSVGRNAMEQAIEVRLNAIQVVCSSSYFLSGYVAHKDASIPQIWPRKGKPPYREPSKRKTLAFYAGAMNSRVREFLVQVWKNDSDISVHHRRLKTPYSEALLGSKYCIHAKGFEVNTARIGDALYYGCVPVVLADHYDLPYADLLNWRSFSVIVSTVDIPMLKKILQQISFEEYLTLQSNVMKVQKHFQWHGVPRDFDAFHMVMYELWIRRSHVRVPLNAFLDPT